MSFVMYKSITYVGRKVYTKQINEDEKASKFERRENELFSKLYFKWGEHVFEQWFLAEQLIRGNAILYECVGKKLPRLERIKEKLYKDEKFIKLYNNEKEIYSEMLLNKPQFYEKKESNQYEIKKAEYLNARECTNEYINEVYDKETPKLYLENERRKMYREL